MGGGDAPDDLLTEDVACSGIPASAPLSER